MIKMTNFFFKFKLSFFEKYKIRFKKRNKYLKIILTMLKKFKLKKC